MILMKAKNTKGFSYVEVMIALALFAIAMLAIIPALSQAGRNLAFAESAYSSHLQAQRIMLAARTALYDGINPEADIRRVAGSSEFSVWVFGRHAWEIHSAGSPDADVSFAGINLAAPNMTSTVIAVVWGDDGQIAGRAIGMMY